MLIQYALLGILSCEPMSGYDLKKIIADSPFMYWSASNSQIYNALVVLAKDELVSLEVQHQESLPSKKIYTITEAGRAALKDWVLSLDESPEQKSPILFQLAWAGALSMEELMQIIAKYEKEVNGYAMMHSTKQNSMFHPKRTEREAALWDMIYENISMGYEKELSWIKKLKKVLADLPKEENTSNPAKSIGKERPEMNITVIEKNQIRYLSIMTGGDQLHKETDILDILGDCMGHSTNKVLFEEDTLSEDFFNLKTGLAGAVIQKFVMYNIKAAVIIPNQRLIKGRMKEMLDEINGGNVFRSFENKEDAEGWLLS